MRTVTVKTSSAYTVKIGAGLLKSIGEEAAALGKAEKICIVSDSNVFPLYGKLVTERLEQSGFQVNHFVFPAGEHMKNAGTFLSLLNHLAVMGLTRTDLMIALGGGVVGDLAGFAAACYMRGIRYIQVPTTLLAAVDSSVGGKTAIDLDAGKNLAGAFWQPSLVLCDTDTLRTLPEEFFRDGCAEVIKYAILYDPDLFSELEQTGFHFDREAVIARCIALKRNVVMNDEFDTGCRMKLNLGHTVGHGVEARSNYSVSHGHAVSIGMAIVSKAASQQGLCSTDCCQQILELLKSFRLPTETQYSADDLYTYALSDKKRCGDSIQLIIPREIGCCEIHPMPIPQLKSFIEAGLCHGS